MSHVVDALGGGVEAEGRAKELTHLIKAARARRAEKGLQFGEGLFDRIEVWAVGRQETQVRSGVFDGGAHRGVLMYRQVVEDDHIPGPERRHEHLLDVGEKRRVVDRAIEYRRRGEAVDTQRRDDRVRLPMTARRAIVQAGATGAATIAPQQIGGHPAFIEKDVLPHVAEGLPVLPLATGRGDIKATLFVGVYRFF